VLPNCKSCKFSLKKNKPMARSGSMGGWGIITPSQENKKGHQLQHARARLQNARVWFNTHKSDFYKQRAISTRRVRFSTHTRVTLTRMHVNDTHEYDFYTLECDSYTQSAISTRSVTSTRTNVIPTRTSVISTRTKLIYTCRIRLGVALHAE
jgi:hypothetical protein